MKTKENSKSIVTGTIFEKAYSLDNYKIEYDSSKNTGICAIYVSSSGIYHPNTEKALEEFILRNDMFEWYNTRFSYEEKHIFIRDVAKQFYITGINAEINSVDKLINFLEEETKNYKLYVIGSSAGGYLASLLGMILNADLIFCFSGYFNLNIVDKDIWFYVRQFENDPMRNKYYLVNGLAEKYKGLMLYFYPTKLPGDVQQSKEINSTEFIIKIPVNSKIHGVPITITLLKDLMNDSRIDIVKKLPKIISLKNMTRLQINQIFYGYLKGGYLYYWENCRSQVKRFCMKIKKYF